MYYTVSTQHILYSKNPHKFFIKKIKIKNEEEYT